MRFLFLVVIGILLLSGGILFWVSQNLEPQKTIVYAPPKKAYWNFQSIDTMKYSRDVAREKLGNPSFDAVIETQVAEIAATGATHVAIAVPYDEEFVPFLERWVAAARRHDLSIWFRGNWSGWEGWFGYPAIGRDEHIKKTVAFILAHPEIFQDGDVFSSCPECENGGPGDPRQTGDIYGFRQFLITEYQAMQGAFKQINKNVRANFFSMNGDVARLIMDRGTTKALDGIVTIDHYVKTPEQLARDVDDIAKRSGGRVVLGEFGAPIPDIHGPLTEEEQKDWIARTLGLLEQSSNVEGMNYWLSVGGSTELWSSDGMPRQAVATLQEYFGQDSVYGFVRDELGRPIAGATVEVSSKTAEADAYGHFVLYYHKTAATEAVRVQASGFLDYQIKPSSDRQELNVVLTKKDKDWKFRILEFFKERL